MTTADYALIVSILSLVVALGGLAWNVWSKFIHPKPKIRVRIAVMNLIDQAGLSPAFIGVYATNFGPTDTTLKGLYVRSRKKGWRHLFRDRWQWGILNSSADVDTVLLGQNNPHSGLPCKLAVGAEFATYLPFEHRGFHDGGISDVMLEDVFGRRHWAPRPSVRKVTMQVRAGDNPK